MTTGLNNGHQQHDRNKQSHTEVAPDFEEHFIHETSVPHAPIDGTQPVQEKLFMWLVVAGPEEQRGTVLPVADGSIIGRHGDIRWHDPRMSRFHARFTLMDDPERDGYQCFGVKPEKDRNGTVINGRKVKQLTPLRENDIVLMGNTRFVVKVLA